MSGHITVPSVGEIIRDIPDAKGEITVTGEKDAAITGIFTMEKKGGQILICTAGEGWYQEEGKEAVSLTPRYSYYHSGGG